MELAQYQTTLHITLEAPSLAHAKRVVRRALAALLPEGEDVPGALTADGAITSAVAAVVSEAGPAELYDPFDLIDPPFLA